MPVYQNSGYIPEMETVLALEPDLIVATRQVGADHVWVRSQMMAELVDVIARHLHPSVRYLAGWDEAPAATVREAVELGIAAFNTAR